MGLLDVCLRVECDGPIGCCAGSELRVLKGCANADDNCKQACARNKCFWFQKFEQSDRALTTTTTKATPGFLPRRELQGSDQKRWSRGRKICP